ncbi:hypothetical protein PN497_08175 [Sphaerospermopsis kisseleviana CS-549]|uniref:Uncharacterized protein n=1 Tax=Sphaerospermopsis kisseleviana CS-549 TaxID=3021783 RepID=A0ABT4ZPJ8_9CYAN|nr:hypothetical protein [Sphaerospermopsis kisseleviana]MDB9441336.1 hypothetical protein [Sphaerospermopsis kisseleviana CS-549]BAZ78941.1 hypothetical protein NIES73_01800 [Sphaerospermopsis kisseleviana NIES-73]
MLNIINTSNLSSITDTVSHSWENTKNFVTDTTEKTVNTLTQVTDKSLNSFSETAEKTSQSLTETFQGATNTVSNSTGKVINKITETATQAKDALTTTTSSVIDNVNQVKNHAVDSFTESAKQAGNLTNSVSSAIENAINNFFNHQWDTMTTWIDNHPTISWIMKLLTLAVNHPVITAFMIFLGIYIIWKIFQLFSKILDQGLLFTLKTPLKLIYAMFSFGFKNISKLLFSGFKFKKSEDNSLILNNAIADNISLDTKQEITKLLMRLEAVRKEENEILENLTALLADNK